MRHASKRAIRVSIHASAREATFNGELSGVFAKGFNPRLRTGGDLKTLLLVGLMVCFNPRLRTGGDTQKSKRAPASCVFQSTPPHGRRHRRRLWTHRLLLVSIHASAREATSSPMQVSRNWSFQSTPPHGRRQALNARLDYVMQVSIHASAREATWRSEYYQEPTIVSIHASAREATSRHLAAVPHLHCFNPRLRTGGDQRLHIRCCRPDEFQSTPPHGRRRGGLPATAQPRHVSIHASAREATTASVAMLWDCDVSIHASAREATP